ncbi:titin-like [Penaeus indicus]|uniref:titin-like n=1 Tax=Penaeus indicus TaxID=29960 RepID=UPI00300D2FE4
MRGAILWLLGVAAVASLPLSDPPRTEQDLMQLILEALPGENDLEGNVVKDHPEAALSVPVTTQSSVNVTSNVPSDPAGTVPADDTSAPVVTTPEQEQVQQQQQQQVAEENHEQVTEQEQMPEEVEQVLEQERAPEQEQQGPEEVTLPEQEQVPEEVQQVPQQEAEEPIPEQDQLPVGPQANLPWVKYFIPNTDEDPEIPGEPLVDISEEPLVDIPEDGFVAEPQDGVEEIYVPEEFPEDIVDVPEDNSEEPMAVFIDEEPEIVYIPEESLVDIPEDGFVAEPQDSVEEIDVPEEFPEDIVDVPEDNSEEPVDVFIVPGDVPEGFMPEETYDGPEGFMPEETYDGPEEIPEEIYENPDVPEEAFSVPEEVTDDLEYMPQVFEGSEDFPQEAFGPEAIIDYFDTPAEVFDAEEVIRKLNFDTFEDASADVFNGHQGTPEVPEGFYDILGERPEGMFVPEEFPQVDGPQDFPEGLSDGAVSVGVPEEVSEDAFDGPQGAPEGFFGAPEEAYPETSPLIPELVPIKVSHMGQEFIETSESEEDSEEDELVNVEPQEYPQEETYDQPILYFVAEEETFVPENADYTPEEEYNFYGNSGMEQDMPQMDEREYIPDDAPIASDNHYVREEQLMIEDGAFMPEDGISNDEAMMDTVNLHTPEGDVIIPGFLPDMSEETSSEEDVPEQFYPQGVESEGEGSLHFYLPHLLERTSLLSIIPITPIAGETFRPDEPLLPIAEEPQTDEADQLTPIMVDNQTFLIPNENDSQRIIFPEDEEPTQSLPVFPGQWDDEKHFFLPIEEEVDRDDQPLTEENFPEFEEQQQPTREFLEQSFRFRPQPPMRRPIFPTEESQDYFDGPQTPQRSGYFHPEPIPEPIPDDDDDIIYPDYDMPAGHMHFDYFMQPRYPQLYGRNGYYPQSINEPSRNLDFTPQNYQIYGPRFGQQSNSPSQFSPFNFRTAMPARSPYRQGYQGPFQFYSGRVAPQSQYETNYGYPWNYNSPSLRPVW